MEEMHHKLISAEDTLTTGKQPTSDRPKVQQHPNHLQPERTNQRTNNQIPAQTNVSNNNSSNSSRNNGSQINGQQSTYHGGTPMHKLSNNRNNKLDQHASTKKPPTHDQDVQNAHMRQLLSK